MQLLAFQNPQVLSPSTKKIARPVFGWISALPFSPLVPRRATRSSSSCEFLILIDKEIGTLRKIESLIRG